jgi:hypothetical protein
LFLLPAIQAPMDIKAPTVLVHRTTKLLITITFLFRKNVLCVGAVDLRDDASDDPVLATESRVRGLSYLSDFCRLPISAALDQHLMVETNQMLQLPDSKLSLQCRPVQMEIKSLVRPMKPLVCN